MRQERWKKNYSSISHKLKSEIAYALKNKSQIILFINRQGMSSFSICSACKNVLRCPSCERALVYQAEGYYQCLHCSYKTDILANCRKCGGARFQNIGIGTQKIEKDIKNEFPGANIQRIDQNEVKKIFTLEKINQDFTGGKIDILIGTQMAIKGWNLPKVALIGIIDADNLLHWPDFTANEKAFQNIIQAAGRSGRLESQMPGKTLIQTFSPENPVIQFAAKLDYENFFKTEISERENLKYPPFSRLIKIIGRDTDPKRLDKEAEMIYKKIKKQVSGRKDMAISPFIDPLVSKIQGIYRQHCIIKYIDKENRIPLFLERELARLPSKWVIDVDPASAV
jgi:primosomal protein N' (replication factor Y)